MRKVFKVLFGISVVLMSCSKSETSEIETVFDNNLCQAVNYYEDISQEYIEVIGVGHNEYLHSALEHFDWSASNYEEELRLRFNLISNSRSSLIDSDLELDDSYDMEYLEKNLNDEVALAYIKDVIALLARVESEDELEGELKSIREYVTSDNECNQKAVVLVFIEVLKNSYSFWSNEGAEVLARRNTSRSIDKVKWTNVVASDAVGAAGAFTGYGLLVVATGPMGWGALCATVAFSSAWSSGAAALM